MNTAPPDWHSCEISTTLQIIAGRWKAVIIFYLLSGTHRFSEIKRYVPGITQRVLTTQLRELEADGIITRHVHAQVPPRVEYAITPFGRTLEPILLSMCDWGRIYNAEVVALRTESPMEARGAG